MSSTHKSLLPLLAALAVFGVGAGIVNDGKKVVVHDPHLPTPSVASVNSAIIEFEARGQGRIHYTTDGSEPTINSLQVPADGRVILGKVSNGNWTIPTSLQWKHPIGNVEEVNIVKARMINGDQSGPVITRTVLGQHHTLPIVSLVAAQEAFFDLDTGLYVLGHQILGKAPFNAIEFARYGSWWKYPGNFQGRGKAWERSANIEYFDRQGLSGFNSTANVRINGQNTRGFPIKSLRVLFEHPVKFGPFDENVGSGYKALLIRTAGNDYNRAILRDPLQHYLCKELPFATSASSPVVLYLCGSYWGIHYLRHRMDEDEIARRYSLKQRHISILEDRAVLYRGSDKASSSFFAFVDHMETLAQQQPDQLLEAAQVELDVNAFLHYMSAQMILGNVDWPDQNLKFWRWEGAVDTLVEVTDGRWRMVMGDSDMGFGYLGGSTGYSLDMFQHVQRRFGPIARLFNALMKSKEVRYSMKQVCLQQLAGPLSSTKMLSAIELYAQQLYPEVPAHVDRWRRPGSTSAWATELDALMHFAKHRGPAVKEQLDHLDSYYSAP